MSANKIYKTLTIDDIKNLNVGDIIYRVDKFGGYDWTLLKIKGINSGSFKYENCKSKIKNTIYDVYDTTWSFRNYTGWMLNSEHILAPKIVELFY